MPTDAAGVTPEAFAAEVARRADPPLDADMPLAIAVSGGSDSLALLWLAAQAFGSRAHVLTADHGLRPQSAAECAMVKAHASGLGLPVSILRLRLPPGPNLQASARAARYAALTAACRAHGIRHLLTAHHRDDQAETLLMRLARGSGVAGLAGIREATAHDDVQLLRPLLGVPRAALGRIVAAAGWTPVDDPSNRDPRFDRTHARRLLAASRWLPPARLAASARNLADADDALVWAADRAWTSRVTADQAGLRLDVEDLPVELRRRLLVRALETLGTEAPDGPAVMRLVARLQSGKAGTLGPVQARADGAIWRLRPAPPRRR